MEVIGAAPSGHCLRHAQLVSRLWLLRALLVHEQVGAARLGGQERLILTLYGLRLGPAEISVLARQIGYPL